MRHPHAVPIFDRGTDVLTVHIAVFLRETGIPQSGVLGPLPSGVGRLLNRMAEAGRADHRAIRAGQTARRHVVPARMFVDVIQCLRQARVVQSPDLALGARVHTPRRFADGVVWRWR